MGRIALQSSTMESTDKRFWKRCGNAVNELFFWLFIVFAVLLAIDLWCMLATAICLFDGGIKSLTLLKIFGAFEIILILFSNFALWLAMYSPKIYKRLISIVWYKRLRLLYFLTLGYMNVYLLNLYYIRFRYSRYELTQYRINVIHSVLVMFPILNIPVYIIAIRQGNHSLPFRVAVKLYLQSKLATNLIQKDYSNLIESES